MSGGLLTSEANYWHAKREGERAGGLWMDALFDEDDPLHPENPYARGSLEHEAWQLGFDEAIPD